MSPRRALGVSAAVLVALVVAAALAVDAVARSALEDALTRTFGTATTVESMDVGLLSGEVTADGIVVSDPDGFASPHFAALAHVSAEAGLSELLGDTVTVRRIALEGLELHLVRDGTRTNFGPVLASVRESAEVEASDRRRYIVRELVVRDVVARARLGLGDGGERVVEVPEVRLTDVGSGRGGATLEQVAGAALEAALRAALARSGGLPGLVSELLRGELGDPADLPGRLQLELPGEGEGGEGGAGERVRDALEEVLPGGGG